MFSCTSYDLSLLFVFKLVILSIIFLCSRLFLPASEFFFFLGLFLMFLYIMGRINLREKVKKKIFLRIMGGMKDRELRNH